MTPNCCRALELDTNGPFYDEYTSEKSIALGIKVCFFPFNIKYLVACTKLTPPQDALQYELRVLPSAKSARMNDYGNKFHSFEILSESGCRTMNYT